ncbi:hypothetical protein WJX75_002911 [Coccomyxa subellipsoidea]|uniref:UBX domain-containing protein n=1 Tax=Coccomyxa subellipsoidea TaxID=248742 RepID=A0ABR2Z3R0_9CHLO
MYYDQAPERQRTAPSYPSTSPQRPRQPPPAPTPQQQEQQWQVQRRGMLGTILSLPRAALSSGFGMLFGVVGLGAAAIAFLGNRIIPASVMSSIRGALQSLMRGAHDVEPQAAAEAFQRSFTAKYGELQPQWQDCGWQAATSQSHSQFKFLFVYLHAPHHQDTDRFCRETLCNPELVEYVNSTFVCWGGDISYPDAYRLSNSLRVTGYPYCALLAFSGARTQLIAAVEGCAGATRLLGVLQQAVSDHGGHLAVEQADANERDFNRRLREEQDLAYQQSLAEDQERERQRTAKREQQAAAERVAAEAAAKSKAQADAEARRVADRAAMLAARRSANRKALKPEAAAGTPATTALRVRLPDGSNHLHRFSSSAALQEVWDWVGSLEELDAVNFSLASSFPRQVFSGSSLAKSLSELGLAPQAALLVQVDDEE